MEDTPMNNHRKITRLLAAILALTTVGGTMIACAEQKDDDAAAATTPAATEVFQEEDLDSLEARRKIPDNLPEMDFDGQKFRVLTYNSAENYIATPEAQEGDVVEDAVFERNKKIEERFGVTIDVYSKVSHRETGTLLEQTVRSADDAYEIYAGHAIVSGGNAVNDMFLNWYDIDHVDFTRPWWNQNSVEALTLNDIMFLVPSYFTSTVIGATYCMFYNKVIAENNNLDNIYDIVNNGEWTLDKLITTVQDSYRDLNGNSKVDPNDAYGLGISAMSPAVTFTWAFDMEILNIDEDFVVKSPIPTSATPTFTPRFTICSTTPAG